MWLEVCVYSWPRVQEWAPKYIQGIPIPTTSLVLRSSQPFPQSASSNSQEPGNSWLLFGRNQIPSIISFLSRMSRSSLIRISTLPGRFCSKRWNWLGFWTCGYLQKVKLWKRLHMIYAFFFVRKIVAHIVTFTFYCVVIPASVLVPEVDLPFWGAVYVPSTITLLNAITTPKWVIPFQLLHHSVGSLEDQNFRNMLDGFSLLHSLVCWWMSDWLHLKTRKQPSIHFIHGGHKLLITVCGLVTVAGHCTCWCSGSFSRTSCPCTEQRPPSSGCWIWGMWTNGSWLRN